MSFGARAVIRLGALKHNLQIIRNAAPGARVMAVIKANAYGHGMLEVANALSGADSLAVARLGEGLSLREAGIRSPIVLLEGATGPDEVDAIREFDFEVVVHCIEQLEMLERLDHGKIRVWLKFDTGMNRLGFRVPDARSIIGRARDCAAIAELGLMSHYANAEDRQDGTTVEQFRKFRSIADGFDGHVSIANSAGIFGWPNNTLDRSGRTWVRPGLALYGISPFEATSGSDLGLRPVMRFESRLISVRRIDAGSRVGYGGTWAADRATVIGIVAAGYADGYTRFLPSGTPVLVNGRRVPLAGRVSMDMLTVDLGPEPKDRIGDPVLLWGEQLPVEEIAQRAGTIPYQLVCGVAGREPALFVDE